MNDTTKTVPYFVIVNESMPDDEATTTDVLVDQFDFADVTEKDLDHITAKMAVGDEIDIHCHYYYDSDEFFIQTLRRVR